MRWRWAVMLASPSVAVAHTGTGLAGGLSAGFAHPFTGFDHLLAMVSVGLWGAFLGRPLIYVLPVVFPMVMVAGAVLGMFGVPLPSVEMGIALSVTVLGTCIALALRAPVWAAAAIVGAFAIFHGYAHGRELPSAADPAGYSTGFVLATGLLCQATQPLGLPLEIVPEVSPYTEPRPAHLPVRVLFEGQPLPGATVKLTQLEHDDAPFETHLTDPAGRAVFGMPTHGSWLLNVVWTRVAPKSSDTDFETVFSSLSFGFSAVGPAAGTP